MPAHGSSNRQLKIVDLYIVAHSELQLAWTASGYIYVTISQQIDESPHHQQRQNKRQNHQQLLQLPSLTMAEVIPTVIQFEVNEVKNGEYEVKELASNKLPDLNSGSRKEFSFDVKFVKVRTRILGSLGSDTADSTSLTRSMDTSTSRKKRLQPGPLSSVLRLAMATKQG